MLFGGDIINLGVDINKMLDNYMSKINQVVVKLKEIFPYNDVYVEFDNLDNLIFTIHDIHYAIRQDFFFEHYDIVIKEISKGLTEEALKNNRIIITGGQ